jgi:hypothetical protein
MAFVPIASRVLHQGEKQSPAIHDSSGDSGSRRIRPIACNQRLPFRPMFRRKSGMEPLAVKVSEI